MMTREEIYGGSFVHDYAAKSEVFAIPDYTDYKVISLYGNDLTPPGSVVIRLPDPKTIRQHGWLVFLIHNNTNIDCDIESATGTPLGFMTRDDVMYVGLLSDAFPIGEGTWAIRKVAYETGSGSQIAEIVNIGSNTGAGNVAEAYLYASDTWVTYSPLDTVSGTGADASAVGVPTAAFPFRVYYGQNASFFEWTPFISFQKPLSNYVFRETGLGVILGSAIGDLIHISNAATGDVRKMEAYGTASEVWTMGPDFPTFDGFTAPEISSARSLGEETFWEWMYFSPSTQDTSAMFIGYNQITQVYFVAAYPPTPRGSYRPSLAGIADRVHFQGGSYSEGSTVAYSTDTHHEYNPFLNSWATLPALPVVGRGLGISPIDDPLDRYFFGMGETTSIPSEVNFEYNLATRTYRARGTFAWGSDREGRENCWARYQPVGP